MLFRSRLVLGMLSLVAGIGWLNSARGMLYSRRKEFQTLRILGFSKGKIYTVAWIQIGIYLLIGIAAGVFDRRYGDTEYIPGWRDRWKQHSGLLEECGRDYGIFAFARGESGIYNQGCGKAGWKLKL